MRRTPRDGTKAHRQDRWSFDAPSPAAAQRPEDPPAAKLQHDRVMGPDERPRSRPAPRPAPRPVKSGESPWRKIQIPESERRRAAAAGLYRYVGKPPADMYETQADARRGAARFGALRHEPDPVMTSDEAPPTMPAEAPQEATPFAAVEIEEVQGNRRRMDDEPATGNPHLGLTVGAIVALSLAAAAGLSWIATPAMDGAAALRADILQRVSPSTQTAERPTERQAAPPSQRPIEVAPTGPAPSAPSAAVQPIEVAP